MTKRENICFFRFLCYNDGMNEKALQTLEFHKIINRLTEHATSEPGRKKCQSLKPITDLEQIEQAQLETKDALERIFKKSGISFGNNKNVHYLCKHLSMGGSISAQELLQIAGLLENAARVKNYGRNDKEDFTDSLTEYFEELQPLTPVSTEIRRCILSAEEIADDASPTLKHIRRSISIAGEKVHSQLNGMVNGSLRSYLQDAVITMRDGRYCLPVKAEEILRPALVKAVGNDRFGRIFELLVIQAVHAAEVRDAGLGGHARAAEEYDPPGFIDPLFECFDF